MLKKHLESRIKYLEQEKFGLQQEIARLSQQLELVKKSTIPTDLIADYLRACSETVGSSAHTIADLTHILMSERAKA
jgi:hypothetical protein